MSAASTGAEHTQQCYVQERNSDICSSGISGSSCDKPSRSIKCHSDIHRGLQHSKQRYHRETEHTISEIIEQAKASSVGKDTRCGMQRPWKEHFTRRACLDVVPHLQHRHVQLLYSNALQNLFEPVACK